MRMTGLRRSRALHYARVLPKSREALAFCIKEGGFVKYGRLKDFDDDMDFFWKDGKTLSTIGLLRQKGLMVVGKMVYGERQFKVAFIPKEIQEGLRSILLLKS